MHMDILVVEMGDLVYQCVWNGTFKEKQNCLRYYSGLYTK